MQKYSEEFKLQVIKYCAEGNHGYKAAAKYFSISSRETVRVWIKRYQRFGLDGLKTKNASFRYDGKFKQNVIEYMHQHHLSLIETAVHFNIGKHSTIGKWEKIYYEKGPQWLYNKPCETKKKMSTKHKKNKVSKELEDNLIAENQRLKMENEYLKKLHALVQERIKRENKKK